MVRSSWAWGAAGERGACRQRASVRGKQRHAGRDALFADICGIVIKDQKGYRNECGDHRKI